jgi:hypothetical protein
MFGDYKGLTNFEKKLPSFFSEVPILFEYGQGRHDDPTNHSDPYFLITRGVRVQLLSICFGAI